jgi:hypothetical protein
MCAKYTRYAPHTKWSPSLAGTNNRRVKAHAAIFVRISATYVSPLACHMSLSVCELGVRIPGNFASTI